MNDFEKHANLGWLGMTLAQTYANLGWVWEGEGGKGSGDPLIGESGNRKNRLNPTPINVRSLESAPIWDDLGWV